MVYVYTISTLIYFLPKATPFPQKTSHNALLKGPCHEDLAVIGQFYFKVITY